MLDVRIPIFDGREGEIRFATSTVADGAMGRSLSFTDATWRNRERFIWRAFAVDPRHMIAAGLEHGNIIEDVIEALDHPSCLEGRDGLLTSLDNVPLVIAHKDCVPIFLWGHGQNENVIGILHTGWRGVLGMMEGGPILPKAVRIAWANYRVKPGDLSVYLGPAIQGCHFEVQGDVAEAFIRHQHYRDCVDERSGAYYVSLQNVLEMQAIASGISISHIEWSRECTYCKGGLDSENHVYFSHRRETHKNALMPDDQMISVIVKATTK